MCGEKVQQRRICIAVVKMLMIVVEFSLGKGLRRYNNGEGKETWG